jgi:hypothetical protein
MNRMHFGKFKNYNLDELSNFQNLDGIKADKQNGNNTYVILESKIILNL